MANSGSSAESNSTNKFTLGPVGVNTPTKTGTTQIGPDAQIRGDIRTKGDVTIAGTVEGEVHSESKLTIAQGGTVSGRISAPEISIEGRLIGDSLASKSLSILASAEVKGDVTTPIIMIEPGASFVGRCSMEAVNS